MTTTKTSEPLVIVDQQRGLTIIPQPTPLTRLNYFDGKFLRASDLKAEQSYLRQLVQQSNQAGGTGIAHGFDVSQGAGDSLVIGPGLAIDPAGRVLLLPQTTSVNISVLIEQSRALLNAKFAKSNATGEFGDCVVLSAEPPNVNSVVASDIYLIVIAHAEALCGEEDVFGKLCEEACVTSTDRPFIVEGLVVRAIPLSPPPALTSKVIPLTDLYLRSRVASAYFETERHRVASLISKAGLESEPWCLGADADDRRNVPIAVVAHSGTKTIFLDPWIARRERMDAPAKRYWQWRMMMRPWDVYMAQILQFQCQLHDLFGKQASPGGDEPCNGARAALKEASELIAEVSKFYESASRRFTDLGFDTAAGETVALKGGLSGLTATHAKLLAVTAALGNAAQNRLLIRGGILELPSAGYLPVVPGTSATVNQQVRQWMGEGVDLRFCVVRPDYVAHTLEEAQHMERISLIEGLEPDGKKPEVDILVPNGEIIKPKPVAGQAYEAEFRIGQPRHTDSGVTDNRPALRGAAHIESPESGPIKFSTAVDFDPSANTNSGQILGQIKTFGAFRAALPLDAPGEPARDTVVTESDTQPESSLWGSVTCSENPFDAQASGQALLEIRLVTASDFGRTMDAEDFLMNGTLTFGRPVITGVKRVVSGTFSGTFSIVIKGSAPSNTTPRLSLEVTATLSTPDNQPPSLRLNLVNREARLTIEALASWSGNPRTITLGLTQHIGIDDTNGRVITRKLFDSTFTQNEEILLPANKLHITALEALGKLGKALDDLQFSPKSTALLFPPAPAAGNDLQIRPVFDWVLFHRRRNKQCSEEVPSAPSRHYQVYELSADAPSEAATAKELLLKGRLTRRFVPVAIVEFGGDVATLLTPADTIKKDWKNVKPGNTIFFGGIANRESAAGGKDLSLLRLDSLEDVLAPISTPAKAQNEFLSSVPVSIQASGVDGVIVLITLNVVESTCHSVYVVDNSGIMEKIVKAINQGILGTVIHEAHSYIEVSFIGATDKLVAGTVIKPMDSSVPDSIVVVTKQGDMILTEASAQAQAEVIYDNLEGKDKIAITSLTTTAFPDAVKCPAITFIQFKNIKP